MTRKYVVRYVKHVYEEVTIEASSHDDAITKSKEKLTEGFLDSGDIPEFGIGRCHVDMICRVNDKGERANIPYDDDDEEIEEVDERDWNRGG